MNFFFGANYNSIYSKLQIPLFQNRKTEIKKIDLFQIKIKKNSWDLEKIHQNSDDNNFYIIDKINNDQVFFLAESSNIKKFNPQELTNLSNFTETFPEFRANLNIYWLPVESNALYHPHQLLSNLVLVEYCHQLMNL